MAQPKHRREREQNPNRAELENLQTKADAIVQRRNDLNAQARGARDERNLLNDKRRELFEKMNQVKAERDAFNQKIKQAKELRSEFQAQAKQLIGEKRAKFKPEDRQRRSPRFRYHELLAEVKDLEYGQQTRVLTIEQEREVLKQLKAKQLELVKVRREIDEATQVKIELGDADRNIDQLFAKAEQYHQEVVAASKASQDAHERYVALVKEVGAASAEANRHHKRFIEFKEKSDEQHKAFLELREKMLELRGKEFASRQEEREIIRDQRQRVRQVVGNPQGIERHAESELDRLKKGGKISLGL